MASSPTNSAIEQVRAALLVRDGAGPSDGELLGSFVKVHDEAALAALVKRHGQMVWGTCRRLLSHHDAEDAFQATFLVLVRKAATVLPREMIGNWLYGVARQTALQARRSAARRRAREVQVTAMPETEAIQQDQCPELQRLLDQELSRLPDRYRAVIVLCDLGGRTRKQVASQLRVPEGTVAGRLARARAMLGKRLALRGVTLSGAALAAMLAPQASAGLPDAVVSSAIRAVSSVAAGQASMGPVSVKAAALAEGVLKAMFMSKLKITFVLALLAGLLLSGGGVVVWQTSAQADQPIPRAGGSSHATPANEQLTKTLVALDKQLWDAAGSGDWKVYDRLLADNFVGRSTVSGESDKTTTVENVKNQRYADWTIRDLEAKEISKDVAILRYVYSCQVTSQIDGTVRTFRDRHTTLVWARRDGAWLLVFCQEDSGARTALSEQPPAAAAAKQRPRQDKEPFTAWGKEIGGLQAGLGYEPGEKRVHRPGETVKLVVRIRNVGKEEVSFQHLRHFFIENPPAVTDDKGKAVALKDGSPRGIYKPEDVTLAPGKEIELYKLNLTLSDKVTDTPQDLTLYGEGKFQLQYERVLGDTLLSSVSIKTDPTLRKLATGKLDLVVSRGIHRATGGPEKEAFTAWGKEINGLQAGLGFRPGEKRAYRYGETVALVVRVRNVGKEAVKYQYNWAFFVENQPAVTDGEGKQVPGKSTYLGGALNVPVELNLAPGEEIDLYQSNLELKPGKFRVQYERVFGNSASGSIKLDPTLSKLATGKLELEIKSEPPPAAPGKEPPQKQDGDEANMKPIRMGVYIEKVNVDTSTITASCVLIGEVDGVTKPLQFENLHVAQKAKITARGKEVKLAELQLLPRDTPFYLFLKAYEFGGFEVVGIETIRK